MNRGVVVVRNPIELVLEFIRRLQDRVRARLQRLKLRNPNPARHHSYSDLDFMALA